MLSGTIAEERIGRRPTIATSSWRGCAHGAAVVGVRDRVSVAIWRIARSAWPSRSG